MTQVLKGNVRLLTRSKGKSQFQEETNCAPDRFHKGRKLEIHFTTSLPQDYQLGITLNNHQKCKLFTSPSAKKDPSNGYDNLILSPIKNGRSFYCYLALLPVKKDEDDPEDLTLQIYLEHKHVLCNAILLYTWTTSPKRSHNLESQSKWKSMFTSENLDPIPFSVILNKSAIDSGILEGNFRFPLKEKTGLLNCARSSHTQPQSTKARKVHSSSSSKKPVLAKKKRKANHSRSAQYNHLIQVLHVPMTSSTPPTACDTKVIRVEKKDVKIVTQNTVQQPVRDASPHEIRSPVPNNDFFIDLFSELCDSMYSF